ncbi:MAG: UPF0280 family protein [Deltaproteobacteria bacterium]|nr:UPF0280 family protein [Deltaproteobacteria bacterium]
MEYVERHYRQITNPGNLIRFEVKIKESDLLIFAPDDFSDETRAYLKDIRRELEDYIRTEPVFLHSLLPVPIKKDMPPLALLMAVSSSQVSVGPMASVAGAIAELTGRFILNKLDDSLKEVIVENGGDIFMFTKKERNVLIFAGESPLSEKLAIKINRVNQPLGICTSSATVGPSKSFGITDACVVVSGSAAFSDAAATAFGNMVKRPEDMKKVAEIAIKNPSVYGILIIVGDKIAVAGDIVLAKL